MESENPAYGVIPADPLNCAMISNNCPERAAQIPRIATIREGVGRDRDGLPEVFSQPFLIVGDARRRVLARGADFRKDVSDRRSEPTREFARM